MSAKGLCALDLCLVRDQSTGNLEEQIRNPCDGRAQISGSIRSSLQIKPSPRTFVCPRADLSDHHRALAHLARLELPLDLLPRPLGVLRAAAPPAPGEDAVATAAARQALLDSGCQTLVVYASRGGHAGPIAKRRPGLMAARPPAAVQSGRGARPAQCRRGSARDRRHAAKCRPVVM